MRIAIVGGKLQGVEAVYLARKAGFETLVVDKNSHAPARGLAHHFCQFDVSLDTLLPLDDYNPDFIFPAVEDPQILAILDKWSMDRNIPMAFDPAAFQISNSKLKSNELFQRLALPTPRTWPQCGFPVVLKPDTASGSQGVMKINNAQEFSRASLLANKPIVVQEFLEGPSYSIEVLGRPGHYKAIQVTDLSMDKDHDCNQVTAPSVLSSDHVRQFEVMALTLAEELNIKGIMDLEVILHQDQLKLLEIDARFPSQTPMAVYWSTGINMVELLAQLFLNKGPDLDFSQAGSGQKHVTIEHIRVDKGQIEMPGEHIMAKEGVLRLVPGFFGADEAITSYVPGKSSWVATLVFAGQSRKIVNARRKACFRRIVQEPAACFC